MTKGRLHSVGLPCTLQDLTAKRYDLEGFAEYTELVRQCKHYSSSTQSLVEGMEEIITVLTTHNISTGSLYTTLEGTLKKWSSFKELLVSGAAFVEKQTPLRAKGLEENIEVSLLVLRVTSSGSTTLQSFH